MSEKVDQIYEEHLADLPPELLPFVISLVHARIAAHYEKTHELDKTGLAWTASGAWAQEELKNPDQDGVFERAAMLATLPKSDKEETEWYYRWIRGNGLTILQEDVMRDRLIARLDNPEKGKPLIHALDTFLETNVSGFKKEDLSDVPEGFSLFATFLVCFNAYTPDMKGERERIFNKALDRLVDDKECKRVMDLFGEISDTKELYAKFARQADWFTY